MSRSSLLGNFLMAASLNIENTEHIIRGQERADAVMADIILTTKNIRLAMLTSTLSPSANLA